MEKRDSFRYWKRPWHKLMVQIGFVSSVIGLWLDIREYRNLVGLQDRVFSASEWSQILPKQLMNCLFSAELMILFFCELMIGRYARSRKSVRLAEGVLGVCLGLAWGAAALVLPLVTPLFGLCSYI